MTKSLSRSYPPPARTFFIPFSSTLSTPLALALSRRLRSNVMSTTFVLLSFSSAARSSFTLRMPVRSTKCSSWNEHALRMRSSMFLAFSGLYALESSNRMSSARIVRSAR